MFTIQKGKGRVRVMRKEFSGDGINIHSNWPFEYGVNWDLSKQQRQAQVHGAANEARFTQEKTAEVLASQSNDFNPWIPFYNAKQVGGDTMRFAIETWLSFSAIMNGRYSKK